jgi:hypothetical protein
MAQTLVDLYPDKDEYYESSDQLLEEDDLVEMDIRILGWSRKFRVRALTFRQMLKINVNATNDKGVLEDDLFTYWTIAEGVIRPAFNFEKAKRLVDKNGEHVKELADQIWNIGRMNKKVFDAYIEEMKRATEEHNKEQAKNNTRKRKPS